MEIQINAVYNVIPLLVRYTQDGDTYEVMVYYNMETNRLIHSLSLPAEIMAEFEKKVIAFYDPSLPNSEHMVRFDDYVTPQLLSQIDGARQGDATKFDGLSALENFEFTEKEEE